MNESRPHPQPLSQRLGEGSLPFSQGHPPEDTGSGGKCGFPHAVIVGGGISGLAAAYRLQTIARGSGANLRITLIEADSRLGGKLQTERTGDLIIEAGPDSFLSQKPAALRLCQELGIADRVIGTRQDGGGTFILRDGRLEPLPEGITMLVPTRFGSLLRSRLLSARAKIRMGLEAFIPPRRDDADESVASFVSRRFGREAFERMAQPLLSGIYAGDAGQLSILSTFPRLRQTEREHGSLIRGMIAGRRRGSGGALPAPRHTPFVSLQTGMGDLVDALVAALDGVDIRLGGAASAIKRAANGYTVSLDDGSRIEADALLLATQAFAARDLLGTLDDGLAGLLGEIPYVSSATISLVYRRSDVERIGSGRGFVIPRIENRELTAVTWVTGKFAGRAPEDRVIVRGFVGRAGREAAVDLPDDDLVRLVRDELREILGLSADPVLIRIYRWRQALPQYVVGHGDRLRAIDQQLAHLPGLYLIGSAYRGVGIPDCIQSGTQAAETVAGRLGVTIPAATGVAG